MPIRGGASGSLPPPPCTRAQAPLGAPSASACPPAGAATEQPQLQEDAAAFPAPWELTGRGYLLPLVPPPGCSLSAAGAIMLVRYDESPVGPYDELVYVPGVLGFPALQRSARSVTRIWVSSQASLHVGRRNWAMPKQLAEFCWLSRGSSASDGETVEVRAPGAASPFFAAQLAPLLPGLELPLDTRMGLVQYATVALRTLVQPPLAADAAAAAAGSRSGAGSGDGGSEAEHLLVTPDCAARMRLVRVLSTVAAPAGGEGASVLPPAEVGRLAPIGVQLEGLLTFPTAVPLC